MLSHLHPALPGRIDDLRRQFAEGQAFRHVVIEPFPEPVLCDRLIAEFPAFDEKHARSESVDVGRKAVFSYLASLGEAYGRFDAVMRNEEFPSLAGRITGIANLLYDPDDVGGGTHENLPRRFQLPPGDALARAAQSDPFSESGVGSVVGRVSGNYWPIRLRPQMRFARPCPWSTGP